jgi:trans-2-enoyl-CoA reductase
MSGKSGKKSSRAYRRLITNLERFKKLSSFLIFVTMSLACCSTLAAYAYQMYLIWGHEYFIARTIVSVTKTIDFETITGQEITYFLFRNTTDGARDADGKNGLTTIVESLDKTCGQNKYATL